MWIRFRRNRLAMAGLVVLTLLYAIVLFSEFFAPYALFERAKGLEQHPPMRVRFIDLDGTFHLRPFVYGMQGTLDLSTFVKTWTPVREQRYPISLFVRGPEYKLLGVLPIRSGVRLFGVQDGYIFLFGSDQWGRDMFSRVLYGGRISMTIGWAGVLISLILGVMIGVASGYFSGTFDFAAQRVIEVLMSVPSLPLWLILSASVPREWTPVQVYSRWWSSCRCSGGPAWPGRCAAWCSRIVRASSFWRRAASGRAPRGFSSSTWSPASRATWSSP